MKRKIFHITLAVFNALLILSVIAYLAGSFDISKQPDKTIRDSRGPATPVDQLSSMDIAVNLARASDMSSSEHVAFQSEHHRDILSIDTDSGLSTVKPFIIETNHKTRHDILRYTTVGGDTLGNLARRFGVTSDSIRWSNRLSASTLAPGTELVIPPINGIVYRVKSDDTAQSLAAAYNSDSELIIVFNDAEVHGLPIGELIVIPDGSITRPLTITSYYSRSGSGVCGSSDSPPIRSVAQGEVIGTLGSTGNSTGPHLHLTICSSVGESHVSPTSGYCPTRAPMNSSGCDMAYGFGWPLDRNSSPHYISQGYRGRHSGIDIAGPAAPIRAIADGEIISCGWLGAMGNSVIIKHPGGQVSTYMHMAPGSVRC